MNLERRISDLETESSAGGVVSIRQFDGETQEQAIAAHIAAGGRDPANVELAVFIRKPAPA